MDYKKFQIAFPLPQSLHDRSYQFIQLKNGILALLITDPNEHVGSCCLSVSVGHYSDPNEIPGLAHLCEHMVCVSSKEYPVIDEYRSVVQDAGGYMNASTSSQETSFYFSIPINKNGNSFETVLDTFSACFRNPLFDSKYANREIYSVDNEHKNNKGTNSRINFQGYKILSNKGHPFSRFSTGNFDSLNEGIKNIDIHKTLKSFYAENYQPEKMVLVIRSPQTINHLIKMATKYFGTIGDVKEKGLFSSKIIKKEVPFRNFLNDFEIEKENWKDICKFSAFTFKDLAKAVIIHKEIEGKSSIIRIAFPISFKTMKDFSFKEFNFFIDFWCELLGDESTESLLAALKEEGLAIELTSKDNSITHDTKILEIIIRLSEKGTKNISKVLKYTFKYLSLFKNPSLKFSKFIAKAMSQFHGIKLYNFLYSEPRSNICEENKFFTRMLLSSFKDFNQWFNLGSTAFDDTVKGFDGAYSESAQAKLFWLDISKKFTKFLLSNIELDNCLVSLVGDFNCIDENWLNGIPDNYKIDPHFDFKYKIAKIDSSIFENDNNLVAKLNLPQPNQFAPNIVNEQKILIKLLMKNAMFSSNSALGFSVKNEGSEISPQLIHNDQGSQLWMKQENGLIYKDKAMFTISIDNLTLPATIENSAAIEILANAIDNRTQKYLYPALLVNYSFHQLISATGCIGIVIHVSGPKSNIDKVLAILVYEFKIVCEKFSELISQEEFEYYKEKVKENTNTIMNLPSHILGTLGLYAALEENTYMLSDRYETFNLLKFEFVSGFLEKFFNQCYLTAFLHGDVDSEYFKEKLVPIRSLLKNLSKGSMVYPSTVDLSCGCNYKLVSNSKDPTNSIVYFIQTNKRDNVKEKSMAKFISYIMTIKLIGKLRSTYQLGYLVQIGFRSMRKTQGIHITIMSGSYDSKTLDEKIDLILMEWFNDCIKRLTNDDFKDLLTKFIIQEKSTNYEPINGSISLTMDSFQIPGSEKLTIKKHKSYWEQIVNHSFAFNNFNASGEDCIDFELVQNFTLNEVITFVERVILPNSKDRGKISILLDSEFKDDKLSMPLQLFSWLSSMGLPIKLEDLMLIMQQSNNSQVAFAKNLFVYYKGKGLSVTLISATLAKMSKSLTLSLNSITGAGSNKNDSITKAQNIDIDFIGEWREKVGTVKD
ncbi:Axl1 protein [Martiniozyma asiatica (nom. inval.)]|nr:Axl1 protein [Martiniozyma asiatica]